MKKGTDTFLRTRLQDGDGAPAPPPPVLTTAAIQKVSNVVPAAGSAKRKKKRVVFFDILAVLFCLAGALTAFHFFWQDLNRTLTKLEAPIAIVYFKEKTAQRRFGDRIVWDVLKQASPIYNGDVLHTADLSQATINFDNAVNPSDITSVDLGENSLIQLFTDRIELASGSISIKTNSSGTMLKLVSAGTIVDIAKDSVVSANSMQAGGGNVLISEGSAQITTQDGTREVNAGDALAVTAEGKTDVKAQAIPISPLPNQRVFMHDSDANRQESVIFTWRTANFSPENFVRFEIARDQRFTRLVNSVEVRSASEQASVLEAGSYWWRVYPVTTADSAAPESAVINKLTVFEAQAPAPITPQDGSTITFRTTVPPVRLQWSGGAEAGVRYELAVSNNPSMLDPVFSTTRAENTVTINDLTAGLWYWQVSALYSDAPDGGNGVRAASQVSSFSLQQNFAQISAPRLISPVDGASLVPVAAGTELFSWRAESEAASYLLQIADGSEFAAVQLDRTTNDNFYNFSNSTPGSGAGTAARLPDGVYFWRVSCTDSTGTVSPYSSIRSFTLSTMPAPVTLAYPPDNSILSESNLASTRFSWLNNAAGAARGGGGALAGEALWQISRSGDFSSLIVDLPVTGTETTGRMLPAGTYYWRVSVPSAAGNFETPPRRFTVNASSKIMLESPANNIEIPGLDVLRTPPPLRWSSTEPVFRSRLLLSTNPNPAAPGAVLLLDVDNPGRNNQLPPLGEGSYYWTVQAESTGGANISPVAAAVFRVGAIPLLPAAVPMSPANNFIFTAAELRRDAKISFAWRGVSGANAYTLSIYRAGDTRRAAPVYRASALRQTAFTLENLTPLDAGSFVWTIEALSLSASGAVEQRGTIRESGFDIQIVIPSSEKLSDEESYGN